MPQLRNPELILANRKETLENWRWDGVNLDIILLRLEVISKHFMDKTRDWANTVPASHRGAVYTVISANGFNSLDETRHYVELLAVGKSGRALVGHSYLDTYHDADYDQSFQELPLAEAIELIDAIKILREKQVSQDPFGLEFASVP